MAEREEELKSLLMKVKEESEKVGLKLNNNGNSDRLYFLGLKIPADTDCSHEMKRRLLLGRKAMTNLDSVLKQRHYFANKGPSSQGCGFSSSHVWM